MRRLAVAIIAAIMIAVLGVTVESRATAQDDPIELALMAQTFAVAPDGVVQLVYEVSGTLPDPTTAPTTVPTSTTPLPSTPAETPPSAPLPSTPADVDAAATASTIESTAATAEAEPAVGAGLTVLVTALERITLRSEVSAVLGGDFRSAVDSAEFDLADVIGPNLNGTTTSRRQMALVVQTATSGEVRGELALPRAGLYPISVTIRERSRTIATHVTFIERLATPDSGVFPRSTLNLSIVAGIPDPGPEPGTLDIVESNARITELAQLGEVITAPLTVAVPPVVAAALDDDPTLQARLQSALGGDEALALPESVLDPSSAVAAGQVEAFTRELREGEDTLRRVLPATATRRVAWLTTDPLSTGGATMLRDLGVQLVVVPFDHYLALESNQSEAIRADLTDPTLLIAGGLSGGGELAVTVVDQMNELLETDRDNDGTPTEVAVQLFADLMAMRLQLGPNSRNFMLATPDLGIPDPDVLSVIEGFVAEHPDVDFQTLSFVPGTTGPFLINDEQVRVTFPETAGPDITARVHEIDLVRLHMEHDATMLPADDPRPPRWRTELEALISTGIDDAEVTRRLDRVERELLTIERAITPPDPFTFTLAGEASTITLRFGNTSTTSLNIVVRVSGPSRLAFPQPDTEVALEPGLTTDVTIPIEARANGTSEVTVGVLTPSGAVIGEPIVLTARVNALSGLGQLLTGAALLVLATWWFSHFRRTRREHRQRDSEPSRNGHPSNRASYTEPRSTGSPAPDSPASSEPERSAPTTASSASSARSSSNGDPIGDPKSDDLSPDAAVSSSSLEQPDG